MGEGTSPLPTLYESEVFEMTNEQKLALANKIFYYAGKKYDKHHANGNKHLQTMCCMVMEYAEYMIDKYEA